MDKLDQDGLFTHLNILWQAIFAVCIVTHFTSENQSGGGRFSSADDAGVVGASPGERGVLTGFAVGGGETASVPG